SSLILAIGFIMIAFTERKQGLHDLICSTQVLKAEPGQGMVDQSVFE
ncbi:MAG: RDD family protein, partial [Rhodobacteraceae bacterium]|nr:RDD family protein [Paracoccaceae bacterium]